MIPSIFLFASFLFTTVQGLIWYDEWGGNVSSAEGCDYNSNDVGNVESTRKECGGRCIRHENCTHFSWAHWYGGPPKCYMKGGNGDWLESAAEMEEPGAAFKCGYVKARSQSDDDSEVELDYDGSSAVASMDLVPFILMSLLLLWTVGEVPMQVD